MSDRAMPQLPSTPTRRGSNQAQGQVFFYIQAVRMRAEHVHFALPLQYARRLLSLQQQHYETLGSRSSRRVVC
jgi:hypothetical protein